MNVVRRALSVLVVAACLLPSATSAQHARRSEVTPSTEKAPAARAAKASSPATDRVNINTADVQTLMSLTGVGKKVAERIVAYRDANGSFKTPEEIRKVEGIGPSLWEKNRARIVVK
jgi:competence protein ComEA